MTLTTNSRIAGVTFLLYIAIALSSMYVDGLIKRDAVDVAARLANIAESTSLMKLQIVLTLLSALCAITIAVTVYGLTRHIDRELALFAYVFRVAEGIIIILATLIVIALIVVASNAAVPTADNSAYLAMGTVLLGIERVIGMSIAAFCFTLGSAFYSYLFIKGRSIPVALAWLGFISSVILLIAVPLQLVGILQEGLLTSLMWMPMLLFEVILSFWLMVKGVREPVGV
jgi:hypothetical protein